MAFSQSSHCHIFEGVVKLFKAVILLDQHLKKSWLEFESFGYFEFEIGDCLILSNIKAIEIVDVSHLDLDLVGERSIGGGVIASFIFLHHLKNPT